MGGAGATIGKVQFGYNLEVRGELSRYEGGGTRTHDLGIKSPLLYQLSYAPDGPKHRPTSPA